ncbi:MAG: TM2 domain-containing protein [Spirosomataceae bacterium]
MKKLALSLLTLTLFATSCKKEMATFQRGTLESFEQPKKVANAPKAVVVNEEIAAAPTALEKQEVSQVAEENQAVVEKNTVVVTPVLPKNQANVQAALAPTSAEQKLTVKEKIAVKAVKKQLKKEATAPLAEGKSQLIALLLALLVGVVGIHRFYLGYTTQGILQLLTAGGCGVWTLIDIIRIATGDLKPKDGNYTETL